MIKRALLFPSSSFLETRWWHRFATVIFWAWFLLIAIFLFKAIVLDPHASCLSAKYSIPVGISDLDCGSNAIDYAISNASGETFFGMMLSVALIFIFVFIAALVPSLAYRLVLYVVKGNSWKDSASAT